MINFPELERESTLGLPALLMLGGFGAVILSFSKLLGLILLIPCVLAFFNSTRISLKNAAIRHQWAHGFQQRVSSKTLQRIVQNQPENYLLHVRYFGGFDATRLTPAAVLENRTNAELTAIYPASWQAVKVCEKAGVEISR